jgi:hypothetical protein
MTHNYKINHKDTKSTKEEIQEKKKLCVLCACVVNSQYSVFNHD